MVTTNTLIEDMGHIYEDKEYKLVFRNPNWPVEIRDKYTDKKISGTTSILYFVSDPSGNWHWRPILMLKSIPGSYLPVHIPNMQSIHYRDLYSKGFKVSIVKNKAMVIFNEYRMLSASIKVRNDNGYWDVEYQYE